MKNISELKIISLFFDTTITACFYPEYCSKYILMGGDGIDQI